MPEVSFKPGEFVFRAGDPGDRAFLLRDGRVELVSGDPPRTVAAFGPGDVFGEMSLIEERPRAFAARASTAVTATALTRAEFEGLLASDPAKCRQYLRSLFERLRSLSARVDASAAQVTAAPEPAKPAGPVAFPTEDMGTALFAPRLVVFPLTRRAAQTLPDEGLIVTKYPLRIGRLSGPDEPEGLDLNDLWLMDEKPFNVSRNHCAIDLDADGNPVVTDRGSHLGVWVNDKHAGGKSDPRSAKLHKGHNVVIVGGAMSPYQFRVSVGE